MTRIRARKLTAVLEDELWPTTAMSWDRVLNKFKSIILPQGGMFTGPEVGCGCIIQTGLLLDGDKLFVMARRMTRRLKFAGIVDFRSNWYLLPWRVYDNNTDWRIELTLESEWEE
jgi:hypothetical protein